MINQNGVAVIIASAIDTELGQFQGFMFNYLQVEINCKISLYGSTVKIARIIQEIKSEMKGKYCYRR